MTSEKPKFLTCDVRVGKVAVYYGPKVECFDDIEEGSDVYYRSWSRIDGVWQTDEKAIAFAQHIVELHNASEIQRVTGWGTSRDEDGWRASKTYKTNTPDQRVTKAAFETSAKAILAAWEFMQQQSTPSR